MEKVAKLLTGSAAGELIKNVVYLLVAFGSLTFAAGTYFGNVKELPAKVEALEQKNIVSESRQEAILQKIDALGADVREIRTVIMRRRND